MVEGLPRPEGDNRRALVAMSGGVDSSVTAWLLQQAGWDCIGVFMRSGAQHKDPARFSKGCCGVQDALDARRVCDHLGIPFYAANFEADFARIVDYFVDEYNAGRTPNPCVQCNRWIKFGVLQDYARDLGAARIATGHYARLRTADNGRHSLLRGIDADKDQSYVLFPLSQEQLRDTLLPLGGFRKPDIRAAAQHLGLRVFDKPDSVEICFVPEDDYRLVLAERTPESLRPGKFLDSDGKTIGDHAGFQNFTVGQRRGLGQTFGRPMYVKSIHAASNTVILADDEALFERELTASDLNWVALDPADLKDTVRIHAQIRYNAEGEPATLERIDDTRVRVVFDAPQRAITPGQAVVFYNQDVVLGGGWIEARQ